MLISIHVDVSHVYIVHIVNIYLSKSLGHQIPVQTIQKYQKYIVVYLYIYENIVYFS